MSSKKRILIPLVLLGCWMAFSGADPDCKELLDRSNEVFQCCQSGSIIPLHEASADCYTLGNGDTSRNPLKAFACVTKCQLESLGLLTGADIDEEKLLENAGKVDGAWREQAIEVVKLCGQRVQKLKGRGTREGRTRECDPAAGFLLMCILHQTIDSCPVDQWQDSGMCSKLKTGECFKRPGDG
ncbi:pheromone-binding protein Gp-9-like [Anopheles bellator]|uniref:pheromone-binding protein Gp-9-like n=1 Tax=Anopheles bellator TaxID=139047 RepID=UPI00264A3202|nr:pheromone-binding protein Gp-9-like [Anopheles bellator]